MGTTGPTLLWPKGRVGSWLAVAAFWHRRTGDPLVGLRAGRPVQRFLQGLFPGRRPALERRRGRDLGNHRVRRRRLRQSPDPGLAVRAARAARRACRRLGLPRARRCRDRRDLCAAAAPRRLQRRRAARCWRSRSSPAARWSTACAKATPRISSCCCWWSRCCSGAPARNTPPGSCSACARCSSCR